MGVKFNILLIPVCGLLNDDVISATSTHIRYGSKPGSDPAVSFAVALKLLTLHVLITCVVLFRQEIETKQCSAYGQVIKGLELPTKNLRQEIEMEQCSAYGQVIQGHELPTRNLTQEIETEQCSAYAQVIRGHELPTRNLRQEIEMEQCSAYGQVTQPHELLTKPQNVDCSADYETVGENDGVYEKIHGES